MPWKFAILALIPFQLVAAAQQNQGTPQSRLSLDQVVTRLEKQNAQRTAALEEFESTRTYRLQYHGFFKDGAAEMVVKVRFVAPESKEFTIISESGSKFVLDHIFKKLLEGEQEASRGENRSATALTSDNYRFELTGYESTPERDCYVLKLLPKTKNRFLYRGKIWVDAKDFAVVRIEGQPEKNPSMWISKTDFEHKYTKVSDFWLPSENRTETSIRFGGRSSLSIEYQDYRILRAAPLHGPENARVDIVPF